MSSAYLRLLIFLPAILIPAYALSSPEFLILHFTYKLNKQGNNVQPWHTPFPFGTILYIMQNARLHESQARVKIAGRNINNLRYADDATLMAESEEEIKSL